MEILNQFGINPVLLLAQVVNFLVLLFILKKLLYGPILKVLDQRRKKIEDSLKNAEEIERKLLQTEEEKEKILARTQVEAEKILDETKKEIEVMKEEGRIQAEQLAAGIMKKAHEAAKDETERLEQEMMGRLAEVVAKGMEKVTGKVLNKKDQMQILEREIKNLS